MSIDQTFSRRRVLVRRVASICGMTIVLPLLGCGSFEPVFDFAGRGAANDGGLRGVAPTRSDYVEGYGQVLASGSYVPKSAEHTALAPPPEPATKVAEAASQKVAEAASPSGGYLLGSMQYGDPRREPPEYGPRRQAPYARGESDYQEADRARGGDYAPEPRYSQGGRGHAGGDYVVQPGDTLYAIAERLGTNIEALTAANGLGNADTIYAGQRLRVDGHGNGYARGDGYGGKPYPGPRPEPRGYAGPEGPRGGPHPDRQVDRRDDYQNAPTADVYQPRYDDARGGQPYEAERYDQQRGPDRPSYQDGPYSGRGQAYGDPRGDEGRVPAYTGANNQYTPDGPFAPSPDAPWRGESEWRHQKPRPQDPDAYEPQIEPSVSPQPRRAPVEAYEPRPAYPPQRPAPKPYVSREPNPLPRGGNGGPNGSYNYTVQRGDTLREIARRNGIDQRELAEINGLPRDARLTYGQELRIPRGEGYDWSRPRPGASNQAVPSNRSVAEAPSAEPQRTMAHAARTARDVKPVASAEPARQPHEPKGVAKPASAPAPAPAANARTAERTAAPSVVAENTAPTLISPQPPAVPAAPAASPSPTESSADVAMNEPAPVPTATTATATAHAATDQGPSRDCEALLSTPEARTAKTFRTPVQGMVVAKFGAQDDGSFNDGINFSVPKGTPIKAAENGVVAYAGDELAGFGNLVLIRHADGYVTAYAHNDELLVKKCDAVKRGQIIAKAGATGKAAAPQLHFELRKDSKPMDPDGHFSGT